MKYSLIGILLLVIFSCTKHNKVTKETIRGMVYNACTGKGFPNATVFFETLKEGKGVLERLETSSDKDGNFSFTNVDIQSNSGYSYAIYIPGRSGIGGGMAGITGTTLYFTKNEAGTFFQPRVTPKFLYFCMDFAPNTVFDPNDSIQVHVQQKIFHKHVPDLPYEWTIGDYGISAPDSSSNYPMGLWNITINKWKNNVHSVVEDSIFLDFNDNKTYIVNW